MDYTLSKHASEMLKERNISENWVWQALDNPDWETDGTDDNKHYFKFITDNDDKVLHVIVNHHVLPKKIVTVFFDRKARRVP